MVYAYWDCCGIVGVLYHGSPRVPARGPPYRSNDEYVRSVRNTVRHPLTRFAFLDYAIVIIMAVFIFASVWWVVSARKWFKGPVRTVEETGSYGKGGVSVHEKEVPVSDS